MRRRTINRTTAGTDGIVVTGAKQRIAAEPGAVPVRYGNRLRCQ